MHSVVPKVDNHFQHHSLPLSVFSSFVDQISAGVITAKCVEVVLPEVLTRQVQSCSGPPIQTDTNWGMNIHRATISSMKVYVLPNARLSFAPGALSFSESGSRRIIHSANVTTDCHNLAGITAFSETSKRIKLAFVLPVHDAAGFYQSMVNRLPALYCYAQLGLTCPIVSTFELNPLELYVVKRLGIDPDTILIDEQAEFDIQTAISPHHDGLAPLFFEALGRLPKLRSPVGSKVYLTRSRNAGSHLVNEAEIESRMKELGFAVVDVGTYSLEERVAIAANAEWIVASHGQELTNIVFSQSTNVIELIPNEHAMPIFKQLSVDCGHRYSVVVGQTVEDSQPKSGPMQWRADITVLSELIGRAAA